MHERVKSKKIKIKSSRPPRFFQKKGRSSSNFFYSALPVGQGVVQYQGVVKYRYFTTPCTIRYTATPCCWIPNSVIAGESLFCCENHEQKSSYHYNGFYQQCIITQPMWGCRLLVDLLLPLFQAGSRKYKFQGILRLTGSKHFWSRQ